MRFADASAYEIMWSETVVVEIGALDSGAEAGTGAKQESKEDGDA
jgi:hypothetical protein